jgi:hypothetical protein
VIRRGGRSGTSSETAAGGWLSWLDSAAKPWTPTGEAGPQRLQPGQVVAERVAVAELQQGLLSQLGNLGTSIQTDEALLGLVDGSGGVAPEVGVGGGLGGNADGVDGWRGFGMSPRRRMAVAARLEHKLLLREALAVLQHYEHHLEDSSRLPS